MLHRYLELGPKDIWTRLVGPIGLFSVCEREVHVHAALGCEVKEEGMEKAVRAYAEVLRLVRRLPKDSQGYYAKYARENFVNYRDVDASDSATLHDLFQRTYNHSLWVLNKYSVDKSAADRLKGICSA